jgi:hypothetical protein
MQNLKESLKIQKSPKRSKEPKNDFYKVEAMKSIEERRNIKFLEKYRKSSQI